uniref:Uncharacterized protein n=1 Tax=Oryzias melastigma TaxID=30732 RepID=A0A3B3BDI1_ORYME
MTGDGGEYLRPEDLRELGDDSLPGQYLDGMNYLHFSLEGGCTDRYMVLCSTFSFQLLKGLSHGHFTNKTTTLKLTFFSSVEMHILTKFFQ